MNKGSNFRELAPGTFVYALDNALSDDVCQAMIQKFENNPEQQNEGRLGQKGDLQNTIKRSTDLRISGRADWKKFDLALRDSLSHGISLMAGLHPFFKASRLHDIGYNLQKTMPGEYYKWHVDSGPGDFAKRQLVAIWYLNQVEPAGGETEFYFQGLSVKPTLGTMILFPPFWTHIHQGNIVQTGVKYIATTWICVD